MVTSVQICGILKIRPEILLWGQKEQTKYTSSIE